MPDKQQHQQEVQSYLQKHFSGRSWEFSMPRGYGNETYFAKNNDHTYFVKLGAHIMRYLAVASIGLTPPVLSNGLLDDGTPIIVQPYIAGSRPSRKDYKYNLEQFADAIHKVHHSTVIKQTLPVASSDKYCDIGIMSLVNIRKRWEHYRAQAPTVAGFVDSALNDLEQQINDFQGTGLVASHNDICNANWLITDDGQLYLIDLDSMSLEDPAVDIGATLWWYYPPELRKRFLRIVGHADDKEFEKRMQVRMALHCLHIILPREESFDEFDPVSFPGELIDFRAILAGKENPQGYED